MDLQFESVLQQACSINGTWSFVAFSGVFAIISKRVTCVGSDVSSVSQRGPEMLLSPNAIGQHDDLVQATITDAQCASWPYVQRGHVADLKVRRIGNANGRDFELRPGWVLGVSGGGKYENNEAAAKCRVIRSLRRR